MSAPARARSVDGRVLDVRDMTTEELEWSDYGRGRCRLVHLTVAAIAFLCVVAMGVAYAFRVGVFG